MTRELLEYKTQGTCCALMHVEVDDGRIVNAEFFGGCNGNLKGIKNLIKGMTVNEVIERLQGLTCNDKPTSCPDQLAKCLIKYREKSAISKF